MNLAQRLISCAVLVAGMVPGAPAKEQGPANSALIQGFVSSTTNGEPVEGVTVTVASDSGARYSITTDGSGTFNLKALPAGHYFFSASQAGFLPYDREQHSTEVSVSSGQQLRDLHIQLTPTGSIAGRVLDKNRQPVANAMVMAIRPTFVNGRQVLVPDLDLHRELSADRREGCSDLGVSQSRHRRSRGVPHIRIGARRVLRVGVERRRGNFRRGHIRKHFEPRPH